MRRSRSALTAWPAFADLMTVLAVLGLAIAAGVAGVDSAKDRLRALEAELAAARERAARGEDRIQELEATLATAQEHIQELEADLTEGVIGSFPCLGTRPGSPDRAGAAAQDRRRFRVPPHSPVAAGGGRGGHSATRRGHCPRPDAGR